MTDPLFVVEASPPETLPPAVSLRLAPIGLRAANEFVGQEHRHHPPTRGHKFSVSVVDEAGRLRGVAIAGRPVSRKLQEQDYIEVTRVCTDGSKNACSMLYGACRRAAIALGYQRSKIVTYTLLSEPGSSLKAAGWVEQMRTDGGSWHRDSRPREDVSPTDVKIRWGAAPMEDS